MSSRGSFAASRRDVVSALLHEEGHAKEPGQRFIGLEAEDHIDVGHRPGRLPQFQIIACPLLVDPGFDVELRHDCAEIVDGAPVFALRGKALCPTDQRRGILLAGADSRCSIEVGDRPVEILHGQVDLPACDQRRGVIRHELDHPAEIGEGGVEFLLPPGQETPLAKCLGMLRLEFHGPREVGDRCIQAGSVVILRQLGAKSPSLEVMSRLLRVHSNTPVPIGEGVLFILLFGPDLSHPVVGCFLLLAFRRGRSYLAETRAHEEIERTMLGLEIGFWGDRDIFQGRRRRKRGKRWLEFGRARRGLLRRGQRAKPESQKS